MSRMMYVIVVEVKDAADSFQGVDPILMRTRIELKMKLAVEMVLWKESSVMILKMVQPIVMMVIIEDRIKGDEEVNEEFLFERSFL